MQRTHGHTLSLFCLLEDSTRSGESAKEVPVTCKVEVWFDSRDSVSKICY